VPGTVVLGAQWGDEGKGKITDLIADRMDFVVRFAGGNNAGHTIVSGNDEFKLHLIPSGILYPHVTPVIGNGLVVNPQVLLGEMDQLARRGISSGHLKISCNAHLVMPYHMAFDHLGEISLGSAKLGTTHRGIGPAYADKADRLGLRMQDLFDEKIFRTKVESALGRKNPILTRAFGQEPFDVDSITDEYMGYAERLGSHVVDSSLLIHEALGRGTKVLFEGAQGTFLDLDHGTYPFVTSSSPTIGGVFTGTGVGPSAISEIIGVAKAYVTRVGYGPFPTEQVNEAGELMGERGAEFGTTTGRKRRCGWLDALLLKYAARINGLTGIALTKLDVLTGLEKLRVGVAYRRQGERIQHFPAEFGIEELATWTPVYEEMPGWDEDISEIRRREDLPRAARGYVSAIEDLVGVPITFIGVGPGREQAVR